MRLVVSMSSIGGQRSARIARARSYARDAIAISDDLRVESMKPILFYRNLLPVSIAGHRAYVFRSLALMGASISELSFELGRRSSEFLDCRRGFCHCPTPMLPGLIARRMSRLFSPLLPLSNIAYNTHDIMSRASRVNALMTQHHARRKMLRRRAARPSSSLPDVIRDYSRLMALCYETAPPARLLTTRRSRHQREYCRQRVIEDGAPVEAL